MNQVIGQIKRDIFTKEILVLNIKRICLLTSQTLNAWYKADLLNGSLKIKKNWLNLM